MRDWCLFVVWIIHFLKSSFLIILSFLSYSLSLSSYHSLFFPEMIKPAIRSLLENNLKSELYQRLICGSHSEPLARRSHPSSQQRWSNRNSSFQGIRQLRDYMGVIIAMNSSVLLARHVVQWLIKAYADHTHPREQLT